MMSAVRYVKNIITSIFSSVINGIVSFFQKSCDLLGTLFKGLKGVIETIKAPFMFIASGLAEGIEGLYKGNSSALICIGSFLVLLFAIYFDDIIPFVEYHYTAMKAGLIALLQSLSLQFLVDLAEKIMVHVHQILNFFPIVIDYCLLFFTSFCTLALDLLDPIGSPTEIFSNTLFAGCTAALYLASEFSVRNAITEKTKEDDGDLSVEDAKDLSLTLAKTHLTPLLLMRVFFVAFWFLYGSTTPSLPVFSVWILVSAFFFYDGIEDTKIRAAERRDAPASAPAPVETN